ncbi:hypothetical protein SDC9_96406 [bioreactor metagenome]|uniref:Phage XkdN-like protein n=1 Tax=bioreactor metagenome TaxID=1076179 RepID=A0A645A9V0_9ZZZZ|nr:hypothetical protein [Candidatus Fimivivens sp.]
MSNVTNMSAFLKKNKTVKANTTFPATKSLCDEKGKPLDWEIKPITTKENEDIQNKCMLNVPVPGKPNQFMQRVDPTKYMKKLVAASVVVPDLYNAELQDSYGVSTPEDLVQEMVDDSGEWNAFIQFINQFNGFTPIQDEVDEAKN